MFNGDLEADGDSRIDSFGAFLGFFHESENSSVALNAGYISDIGDSDTLQDTIQDSIDAAGFDYDDQVGGVTVSGVATFGAFNVFAEYLTATDDFEENELAFDTDGAKPEAFNIELGYHFTLANIDMTAAVAYQGTDEAVALELPKERFAAAISAGIFENTALSLECIHDNDYSDSDGGTDEFGGTTVTAQLAVEF